MPYGPGGDQGPLDYSDEITGATAKERAEYENWKRKEREERKKREEERKKKQKAQEEVMEKQIRRIDQLFETCSIDELRPPRILYGSEFNEVL